MTRLEQLLKESGFFEPEKADGFTLAKFRFARAQRMLEAAKFDLYMFTSLKVPKTEDYNIFLKKLQLAYQTASGEYQTSAIRLAELVNPKEEG